ncbi:hypothetical protein [Halobacillus sp. Marseille-P3879]|uniref:hypothetical protein n=1 Tax=Halobacillus TaxID=45667 RepID=UPI001358D3EF|nr:hypothetical protein [Halobacillus sp. Marseille-P3879]
MNEKKKDYEKETSNEAAELFSHPSKLSKAFNHEETKHDTGEETEGEALMDHFSDHRDK